METLKKIFSKKVILLLKVLISLGIIAFIIVKFGGIKTLWEIFSRIKLPYVLLILLLNTSDRFLMTYKWSLLLRSRGLHLPLLTGVRIYCASMVWGLFLPATIGADAIRTYSAHKIGLNVKEVVSSIIIERMIGFISALLFGLFGLFLLYLTGNFDTKLYPFWWLGISMILIMVTVLATSFHHTVFNIIYERILYKLRQLKILIKFKEFHKIYFSYSNNKGNIAVFFVLTLIEQIFPILHSWLIAICLDINVGIIYIAGVVPLAFLIARIPISFDGLGVFDGVFASLMLLAGLSPAESIAITLLGRILQTISWTPWWFAYIIDNGGVVYRGQMKVGENQKKEYS